MTASTARSSSAGTSASAGCFFFLEPDPGRAEAGFPALGLACPAPPSAPAVPKRPASASAAVSSAASDQGRAFVYYSAQRKHFLRDTLGGFRG